MKQRFSVVIVFLACCLIGQLAAAQTATLHYESEEGDYIGGGQTRTYTEDDGIFVASGHYNYTGVRVYFDHATAAATWWDINCHAPNAQELTPGFYPSATRYPFQAPASPGLDFSGSGRGCNTLTGEFTVHDVVFDYFGVPRRFSASLEQHCEGMDPALYATIDYQSDDTLGPVALSSTNVLVASDKLLYEFTTGGTLVRTIPVIGRTFYPSITERVKDLVLDFRGRLHVFVGTDTPNLLNMTTLAGTWSQEYFSGWGVSISPTEGAIAAGGDYVFVNDMANSLQINSGIIRFDTITRTYERFYDGNYFLDLNVGLDGLLYALGSGLKDDIVSVFDPTTMDFLQTIGLDESARAIAVSATGDIFGAVGNTIHRFDATGTTQDSLAAGTSGGLIDLDLSENGVLLAGSNVGEVVITSSSLSSASTFAVGTDLPAFVAGLGYAPLRYEGFESGNLRNWSVVFPSLQNVTVQPAAGLITSEGGLQASFTVGLTANPTANVAFPVSSSDPSEGTVSTSLLTFTPGGSLTRTVTVTGVNDSDQDGDQSYSVVLGEALTTDGGFQGADPTDVSLTNVDDDGPSGPSLLPFETAILGTTGQGTNSGFQVSSAIFLGAKFTLAGTSNVTSVGGHFVGVAPSNKIFVAILPLDSGTDFPVTPFDPANAVFSASFNAPATSDEVTIPASFQLAAGRYAIVFGSGFFGATGTAVAPGKDVDVGGPEYFYSIDGGDSYANGGLTRSRFFVNGSLAP